MKKKEIINEIKNVVMNNGGYVNLNWVSFTVRNGEVVRILHGYEKNVKYEKVEQIKIYLDCLTSKDETVENKTNDMAKVNKIEEIKNAITSNGDDGEFRIDDISYYVDGEDVKVLSWHYKDVLNDKSDEELNQHLSYIKGGIKKNIIKGLKECGAVKCDLEIAEALETDGFITIEDYCDGIMYGEINKSGILKAMFDGDELEIMEQAHEEWSADMDYIETVTYLCDEGYLYELKYNGDGIWYCRVDWNSVICYFYNHWDFVEKEAA